MECPDRDPSVTVALFRKKIQLGKCQDFAEPVMSTSKKLLRQIHPRTTPSHKAGARSTPHFAAKTNRRFASIIWPEALITLQEEYRPSSRSPDPSPLTSISSRSLIQGFNPAGWLLKYPPLASIWAIFLVMVCKCAFHDPVSFLRAFWSRSIPTLEDCCCR